MVLHAGGIGLRIRRDTAIWQHHRDPSTRRGVHGAGLGGVHARRVPDLKRQQAALAGHLAGQVPQVGFSSHAGGVVIHRGQSEQQQQQDTGQQLQENTRGQADSSNR